VNSVILCVIGIKTHQFGLVPANLFCLAMYGYNVFAWRSATKPEAGEPSREHRGRRASVRFRGSIGDEHSSGNQHRIRQRFLPGGR
jgi:hypothetical protein